jgi:hypothetical protein
MSKISTQHFQNIRTSMQFAFNSSMMPAPSHVKSLTTEEACARLPFSSQDYSIKHAIKEGQVGVSVANENIPPHSPFGSWMNMYFPFSKDADLRQ